ncbi:MAG: esterase/lipase family protein [Bdellovibrionota bacterium]
MANDPLKLRHPIVLVHGLGARSNYGPISYFYGIPERLKKAGNTVFVPSLKPWQTIEKRSEQLVEQIRARFPDAEKLNFVGHSLGGLDIRYAVSKLGLGETAASVTTVGTPNRGSVLGEMAAHRLPERAYVAIDRVLQVIESSVGAFRQITRNFVTGEFAELAPDVPGVAYFSAMSAIRSPMFVNALPMFWGTHPVVKKLEGDNDGFVSVESSKWGTHICTYSGDHYAQVGHFLGRSRGMNYQKFWDEIIDRLGREGF